MFPSGPGSVLRLVKLTDGASWVGLIKSAQAQGLALLWAGWREELGEGGQCGARAGTEAGGSEGWSRQGWRAGGGQWESTQELATRACLGFTHGLVSLANISGYLFCAKGWAWHRADILMGRWTVNKRNQEHYSRFMTGARKECKVEEGWERRAVVEVLGMVGREGFAKKAGPSE